MATPKPAPPPRRWTSPDVQRQSFAAQLVSITTIIAGQYLYKNTTQLTRQDIRAYICTLVSGKDYEGAPISEDRIERIHLSFARACLELSIEAKSFPGQNNEWYEAKLAKAQAIKAGLENPQ